MRVGCVYLVGAGPGDPELLTVKAHRLLGEADVVVYDRLISPAVLDLIRPGAARIYVGKADGRHTLPQDEINDLLVRLARGDRQVVRLKGGDPFIFGRGGEEAAHLAAHGVPCQVVPGITAAAGCAAALGVPLTHRGVAESVRLVTGHIRNNGELDLDWSGLADPDTTLVIYMGLGSIERICHHLIIDGLAAETPALAVSKGTTPDQNYCRATLASLAAAVTASRLEAPLLVFIGNVIAVSATLDTGDHFDVADHG
jgi:uroporphyrin-III C-methyltransferase